MNYERNNIYFNPIPPKSMTGGIIVAVIGFIIMIAASGGGSFFGFLVLAAGGVFIFLTVNFNNKRIVVADDEIDRACRDHLKDLKKMAMKKLGIDEDQVNEAEPINFDGYYYQGLKSSGVRYRKGDDGLYRSSNYNAVIFLFSSEQVFCYEYRFSLIKDEKQETTDEYFYKDVVSVSTKSDSVTYGSETINFENFSLTTSGGTSVQANIYDSGDVERSISAMKSLLRSKKQ